MHSLGKVLGIALLSITALVCSTVAAYLLSMLWWGKYQVVVIAAIASAFLAVLAIAGVAAITARPRNTASVLRLASLLAAGCATASAGLYFLLLANCSLSCGNRILTEAKSPDGHLKAVWFLRQCVSSARCCPSVSYVSILPAAERLPDTEGNAFSVATEAGVSLKWKADDLLLITYPSIDRSLRQEKRVGRIRIEYLPIGYM
jgi:hypothetical protein